MTLPNGEPPVTFQGIFLIEDGLPTALLALESNDRRILVLLVGRLLAITGTKDIVDAHVTICAGRNQQAVVTTDAEDLRRLDPDLAVVAI